jgi:hypothetical protein
LCTPGLEVVTAARTFDLGPFSSVGLVVPCPDSYVAVGGAGVVVTKYLTVTDAEYGGGRGIQMGGIFRNNWDVDAKALGFATCIRQAVTG